MYTTTEMVRQVNCFLVLGLVSLSVLSCWFLRLAVGWHNARHGRPPAPGGVPEPTRGSAVLIGLVSFALTAGLIFLGAALLAMLLVASSAAPQPAFSIAVIASIVPVYVVSFAAVTMTILPTSFEKAFQLSLHGVGLLLAAAAALAAAGLLVAVAVTASRLS